MHEQKTSITGTHLASLLHHASHMKDLPVLTQMSHMLLLLSSSTPLPPVFIKVTLDVHGCFTGMLTVLDIATIWERLEANPQLMVAFVGDYVDRNHGQLLLLPLLAALKARFPTQVVFLRGNHEVNDASCWAWHPSYSTARQFTSPLTVSKWHDL